MLTWGKLELIGMLYVIICYVIVYSVSDMSRNMFVLDMIIFTE